MDDQLQQLIELQKEQNQLLKRYLWRLRFSLLTLLLLTTALCGGLGFLVYQTNRNAMQPKTPATGTLFSAPTATVRLVQPQVGLEVKAGDELFKVIEEEQGDQKIK
jgi:hypothetical protein